MNEKDTKQVELLQSKIPQCIADHDDKSVAGIRARITAIQNGTTVVPEQAKIEESVSNDDNVVLAFKSNRDETAVTMTGVFKQEPTEEEKRKEEYQYVVDLAGKYQDDFRSLRQSIQQVIREGFDRFGLEFSQSQMTDYSLSAILRKLLDDIFQNSVPGTRDDAIDISGKPVPGVVFVGKSRDGGVTNAPETVALENMNRSQLMTCAATANIEINKHWKTYKIRAVLEERLK